MHKICVIGLGYIGLPTAAMFARAGFNVLGVDINKDVIEMINKGEVHLEEKGLADVVKTAVEGGKLKASLDVEEADVFIIAVPTPIYEDYTANLDYVILAVNSIVPYVKKGNVIIIESTIPPRTIDDVIAPLLAETGWDVGDDLFLAHCPERVLPGRILNELVENTRIVGGFTPDAAYQAAEIYRTIVTGEVIETEAITAEMSKLMENTYRDVNIALVNELTKISAKLGINTLEVIRLANFHPRVNLHLPGPGVGGHCLAVDPYFIVEKASEVTLLIKTARQINNSMPHFVVEQVKNLVDAGSKIAVFGLTYKGNIDDIRESPAVEVVSLLDNIGYEVALYDPHVSQEKVGLPLCSFEEAIQDAECILVLTDHYEFKEIDEKSVILKMKKPVIFDTKNCMKIRNKTINYYNFGNISEINTIKMNALVGI